MPKIQKKQPETKLRRIQPERRVKKNCQSIWPRRPKTFDMIGDWISNYGMTGENLAHWIFSYLDFSTLQQGRLVCKSWCRFLTNDRLLWLNMLMRTKPYVENLFNRLSYDKYKETSAAFTDFANDYFERIKKKDSLDYGQMCKLFGKIQSILIVIIVTRTEEVAKTDLQVGLDLKRNLIGQTLFHEFIAGLEKMNNPFYIWLRKELSVIRFHKGEIRHLKKEIREIENTSQNERIREMRELGEFLQQIKRMMEHNVQTEENLIQKWMKLILTGLKTELTQFGLNLEI